MSASLVGSEMCIRDRSNRGSARQWGRRSQSATDGLNLATPAPQLPVAVSYTHLTLPTICSV
eukprot:3700089-Alexandrium_andersonii.AAC.1